MNFVNIPGTVIPWQPGETVLRFLPNGKIYVEKVTEIPYPPKRIDPDDLEDAFARSYVQQTILEDRPGILPKGTVECITASRGNEIIRIVVILREKCIRPFKLGRDENSQEQKKFNVGYPKLLFKFTVSKDTVGLYVRAVKTSVIRDSTELYYYPYTNIHVNGEVCLGTYRYPPVKELRHLETYPDVFYELENLPHLYHYHISLGEMIELNKDREFDDSLLVPCRQTYAEWVSLINLH